MQPRHWLVCLSFGFAAMAVAAEDSFSRAVRSDDFSAAGLTKLTAEELARLDALVREFKSGALTEVESRIAAAAQAKLDAEGRAARAEAEAQKAKAEAAAQKQADASRLEKAKALLTTNAAAAIEPFESRIVGKFIGWDVRTVFTLENGQRWRVANNGSSYHTPAIDNPKVKVAPAALGGFWMVIEAIDQRVKVIPLSR